MSLYLCVFEGDEELDGVAVGAYSDFGNFRDTVTNDLEGNRRGSRFPTLMIHSDCDGEWTLHDCCKLKKEIETISAEMKQLPPREFLSEWQQKLAISHGLKPQNLSECFIDLDGEPLLERLLGLVNLAQKNNLPILFQ
jgi:hypothetical protein